MLASPSTVLLTGATGLVGRYLLRDLLLRDQKVIVIGRGRGPITGEDRIEALLQDWEQRLGRRLLRPVFIEGHLTEPGLGIQPDSN
ncbi:MAG: SDR family oxidoreductase, partial [Pirellulaceae bacterium]